MLLQVDELTVITENDWISFCKDWNCMEEKGISAEIDISNSAEECLLGTSEEMPITEENVHSLDDANGETESQGPIIITYPEVFFLSLLSLLQLSLETNKQSTAFSNF